MKKSIRLAAGMVILALATLSPIVSSAAAAAPSATTGLSYVALGDSYAAGRGLTPTTGKPVPGCDQSSIDYPHRVAESLGMSLTDVSCSGATTANVISKPQKTVAGTAPVQLPALSSKTRVVTITIGGNDIGFFTTASACVALSPTGPILSTGKANCRETYVKDGVDTLADRVSGVLLTGGGSGKKGLTTTFAAVKKAAPNARVFVVGYPTILPDPANTPAAGCFRASVSGTGIASLRIRDALPFTSTDVRYLNSIEQSLDAATRKATEAAGFTYVSTLAASATHSACAPADESYINGVSLASDASLTVTLATGSLHPNAGGAEFMANLVEAAVTKAFPKKIASGPSPESPRTAAPSPVPWIAVGAVVVVTLVTALLVIVLVRRRLRTTQESERMRPPTSAGDLSRRG